MVEGGNAKYRISSGMVFRLLTLMTHYRQPLNFSHGRMEEAERVLIRWLQVAEECSDGPPTEILSALCEDLNSPKAIAAMHVYRKNGEGKKLFAAMRFLGFFDAVCLPDEWKTIPRDQLGSIEPGPQTAAGFVQ